MKSWHECCNEVGYNRNPVLPKVKTTWYAYKHGEAREFDNGDKALKFSSNIETCIDPDSKKMREEFWENQKKKEKEAEIVWYNSLYNSLYADSSTLMTPDVWTACYNKAYAVSHADGFDSIAETMRELVDFAMDIRKCT